MRLSQKVKEAEQLWNEARLRRQDAERLEQNDLKRYNDAGDASGAQNVQHEIDTIFADVQRIENIAASTEVDASRLQNEINTAQKAIEKHLSDLRAYEDQVRTAQSHIDSINHDIANLKAQIQSIS